MSSGGRSRRERRPHRSGLCGTQVPGVARRAPQHPVSSAQVVFGRIDPMEIAYLMDDAPTEEELIALYTSVGWTAYTVNTTMLHAAIAGSSAVVTARDHGRLVGLARVISDGQTIVYLQDILVEPSHHRTGIGRELMQRVIAPFDHVRQKVLLTDDDPAQRSFYESAGFTCTESHDPQLRAFVRLG